MSKKKARWRKLDNAAKLYSAASNKKDTRVFRFYCELKEEVNPDVLQEALNQTIEIFPTFLMVLRKGLFWHYLEPCNLRPIVKEEYKEPCSRLYIKDKKTLLFEVTYYKKRINFEVFHVLTDGTGATEFLKELVKNYLYLIHKVNGLEPVSLLPEDMTVQDQEVDSFLKYYSKDQKRPKKRKLHAFQIRRKKKDGNHLHVHESVASVQTVLKRSRLIAFLDYECGQQLQEHQKCCRQSGRNYRMSIKGIYDIHCHIVPGVDDGATDIGETVKLLRMEYEQGVRTVIATPHFRFRMFETPAEKVREQFRLVEKAASEISPDLHVYLGCEFHANMEMLPMLREQKVMTMAGSRYVLTEFSHNSEESYIRERLGALLSGGYKPIMAHIERYEATRNSLDFVEELADMGVYMQINADSITGKDGFFAKRYCNKIMKDGLLHFVGSDCHNSAKRSSRIGEAYRMVSAKFGQDYADELFIHNPAEILKQKQKHEATD